MLPSEVLFECGQCEFVFASPMPDENILNNYYSTSLYHDQVADPFQPDFLQFSLRLNEVRLTLIDDTAGKVEKNQQILDIGAGNASFGKALSEKNTDAVYEVVEPSEKVRAQYGEWVHQSHMDLLEVQESAFDLVIMNQILEHVPDPVAFIQSVMKKVIKNGFIYIDVPFRDYLFKPSVEPHLLFWNKKSMTTLIEKVGLTMIFCDTAGMPHSQANRFFNQQSSLKKIGNPWFIAEKANRGLRKLGLPKLFDTFLQFQADRYGGDRQWLRCIAQKMD